MPPRIQNTMKKLKKAYLEITNVCNLNCLFCPGTKREKRFMDLEEFRFLSARIRPHTDYLYLHLMGEPLLHPQLPELLDCAGDQGFRLIITTNGTLLSKRKKLLLNSPAVHKVNVSLQSFEANEGNELEAYMDICADFAAAMSEAGKLCVLRLWNSHGFDSLNSTIEGILQRRFPKPWTNSRGSRRLADKLWLEPGEKFDWPDLDAAEGEGSVFCYGLRDQVGILVDGTVVPCCLDHEGDIPLGNLFEQQLEDILTSPRALAIYEGFNRRQAVEKLCRKCGYARRFS